MRVVAGRHRGRALLAPEGRWLRPTADRVRESVFNVLAHSNDNPLGGARVLDAFCGTGAMGIEALSRGASHVTFIDDDKRAIDVCRKNLSAVGESGNATLLKASCFKPPLATSPCSLVFLDPPYREDMAGAALVALSETGWIAKDAMCVIEISTRETFDPPEGFSLIDDRRYGAARVVFLCAVSATTE